jgi:type I restriction-modification system DNA methylase subunit
MPNKSNERRMKNQIFDIDVWRNTLGLFPMPLFRDSYQKDKFILLNGGLLGNLCLDFKNSDQQDIRSFAWSADVGQYLTIEREKLIIHRWYSVATESYNISNVENKLEIFYDYLRKQEFNKQDSVVRFIIQFYRKIRTLLRDNTGNNSLNVLLYLLTCVAEGYIDRDKISLSKWGLSKEAQDETLQINDERWSELLEVFRNGLKIKNLQPRIDLILRHASGSLFQEAHFETIFPLEYQQTFDQLVPQNDKILNQKTTKQTSSHFTPTSIVRTIVEESLREFSLDGKKEISVLDPACGSGEFLKEFLRQVRLKGFHGKIKLYGWDISSTAIDMAKFIINYEANSPNKTIEINIVQYDALADGTRWKINIDFLLMNPPFVSWELMDIKQQEKVSTILENHQAHRPNTAGAFLWNAINCLKDEGVIGCVLPTSIFENDSYVTMRKDIKDIIDVKMIGRLGSHSIFSDALVDAAIFVGVKQKNPSKIPLVIWSDYKSENSTFVLRELRKIRNSRSQFGMDREGYSLYENKSFSMSDKWMPIPLKSYELLERYKNYSKVEDIFVVRQGVRTGLNSVFLVTEKYFDSLPKKEKKYFRPAVTNESIDNHRLHYKYYIFYAEGDNEISTRSKLEKAVPTFYRNYLKPNFDILSSRARKGESNFWRLSEPRAWARPFKPKILSKEFGQSGSFVFDKTGEFIPERSHAWLPKGDYNLTEIGYAYVTILSMPIINDFLRGLSKQIGGGQWYLSSKFINKMPMPNLFEKFQNQQLLDDLISIGEQLSNGQIVDKSLIIEKSSLTFYAQ